MQRCKKNKLSALLLKLDEISTTEAISVANGFRDHFVSVYTDSFDGTHPVLSPSQYDTALCQVTFRVADVGKLLKQVNPYSAMGPDYIHPRILKEAADTLALPLLSLFSYSLSTGVLPAAGKEAHVTPIYKSGDRDSYTSYCPISFTSMPCKIVERLIKKAILTHLQRNELISDSQHGFLPGRSCTTNLLLYMDSLTQASDDGLISDTIFFDFTKAFDKVPHKPLLHKLHAYGVCGELLQWINSFLTDRSFCVNVDQTLSSLNPVYSGAPQGSVLGPLLFLVYINDLVDVTSSYSLLYADDLKIWTSDDPNAFQEVIINVKNWSISWKLPINDAKCAHIFLGGTSGNRFIIHDGTKASDIPTLDLKKDLGVWIASNFSFKHHLSLAAKKGFGLLNMIKRTFPRINRDDFEQLYATYVRLLLEYASFVVHTGMQTDILCLERVQRTAMRLVHGIRTYPYCERLLLPNVFPLDIPRLLGDLILTFRLFAANQTSNFFTLAGGSSLRGHDKKILKPHCRTSTRLRFCSVQVMQPWNSLPQDVVCASSLACFKTRLDTF